MGRIIILKIEDESDEIFDKIFSTLTKDKIEVVEISSKAILSFPGLRIDLTARRVLRDDSELFLTHYEYNVLCYLARHAGWIRTRQQIFEAIWHEAADVGYHAVENIVYQLRQKIESDPSNPQYIHTVVGHGYKFIEASSRQL